MAAETSIFIGSQIFFIFIFTVIGLVAVKYRQRALQREVVIAGFERKLSLEAYQRFAAARVSILLKVRRINSIIVLVAYPSIAVILAIIAFNSIQADYLDFSQAFHFIILLFPAIIIGLYVAHYIHDIVGSVFVDVEALRISQMSSLQRSDIVTLKVKTVLLKLVPLVLYFEVLGGLVLFGYNLYAGLLTLLCFSGIAVILNGVFAFPFYAWTNSLHPIEQTQWAVLAPRIEAWARLAGINFASVQVQQDLVGTVNVRILGLGRPTLIISETFLSYTEWRQQDAMIGILLGLTRKQMCLKTFLRNILLLVFAAFFVIAIQPGVFASFIQLFPFASAFFATFSFLPLVLILYVLLFAIRVGSRRFLRTVYFDADRIAALLTGDPMAVMVVLNTVNALNGMPATQGSILVPATGERMQRLDMLIRQPWTRAPQSASLVPASTAVSFGPYYLTMPFANSTRAEPVPSVPYVTLL